MTTTSLSRPAPPALGAVAAAGATAPSLAPPLPRFAQFEPTGRCNLACRMCGVNERGDEIGSLSLQRLRELLDAMPQLEQIHLQGLGEPMLNPAFFDMVELATARGLWMSANTNLTLLTEARAERCVRCGLAALSVSIDGASAAVYEAIRGKASFAKLLRNLRRLTGARDRIASPIGIRGVMVLMRGNLHELPALVRLLHGHGVYELLVQRLAGNPEPAAATPPDAAAREGQGERPGLRHIEIARYIDDADLRTEDLPGAAAVFDEARAVAQGLGVQLHLPKLQPAAQSAVDGAAQPPTLPPRPATPRCGWPWEQIYVTAAGHMLPCCMVGSADRASFGKAFDAGSTAPADPLAAWHGEAARAFRAALIEGPPPAVCRGCALYERRF